MSLSNTQQDVQAFHEKFGLPVRATPSTLPPHELALRQELIREEAKELLEAMDSGDLAEIGKEMADLLYVTLGAATTYGISLAPVWEAVHASNMSKTPGSRSPTGKILKGADYRKPDIQSLIEAQR